ncbi:MAG TPA: DUF2892 domain-containing protein [Gemmatimonadales bacterium]|nr:DUF2892 domain-containing protein [Gemmatimonadales bacterium]
MKNMGTLDRTLRFLVAAAIAFLYYTGRVGGILGMVLLVLAVVFVLTSFIGWCPLYTLFGFGTRGKPPAA